VNNGKKTLALFVSEKMPNALTKILDGAVQRGRVKEKDVLFVDFR
jgi:hypothetical protein